MSPTESRPELDPADPSPLAEGREEAPPGVRAMAWLRWALLAAMVALAAFTVGSYWVRHASPALPAETMLYQCPMHPTVVQDHPGECPICHMTLVPKLQEPAGAAASPSEGTQPGLALSPERIRLAGLTTSEVERVELAAELRVPGVVSWREGALTQVHPRVSGWVERVLVPEAGRRVRQGEVLATFYSPELVAAQQELLNARSWSEESPGHGEHATASGSPLAGQLVADARSRLGLMGLAAPDIEALLEAGTPSRAVPLRSPRDGWLAGAAIAPGSYAEPASVLFEIGDLSRLWVAAEVPEASLGSLHLGSRAEFKAAAFPGRRFSGPLRWLAPALDATTRTLAVKIELENRDLALRPGLAGTVILPQPATSSLVVPADAVIDTGREQYVFVAAGQGRFTARRITLGSLSGERASVLSGLEQGEKVVSRAAFLLDSESRLSAAIGAEGALGPSASTSAETGPDCATAFDAARYPEAYRQCRACEVQHPGMGSMVADCKNAIARPWR